MSAINMDLDKQFKFNFKRDVIIGGRTYHVTFNDEMDNALRNLQLEISDFYNKQTQISEKFEDEMNVEERKNYLATQQKALLNDVFVALDSILGVKGAGESIYNYYNHQSYALFKTIKVLRNTKEKLDGTNEARQREKHEARAAQYTGKKKRVNEHAIANKKRGSQK